MEDTNSAIWKKTLHIIILTASGLVISVSASHAVGRGFGPRPGHTKDHHRNGTNCLPAWRACIRVGVRQCNPTATIRYVNYLCGHAQERYPGINLKRMVSFPSLGFLSSDT